MNKKHGNPKQRNDSTNTTSDARQQLAEDVGYLLACRWLKRHSSRSRSRRKMKDAGDVAPQSPER